MLSATLAVLVLAVTPASAINGGTPQQQARVKAILDRLPECITAPGGVPVAVKIVSGTGPQAIYDGQSGTLEIDAALLDAANFMSNSLALRQDMCVRDAREVAWMVNDTQRVIVHELAHAYQKKGMTGRRIGRNEETVKERLDAFFKIRFDSEFELWTKDPIRKEYEADLVAKLEEAQRYRKARRAVPPELLQEICDLHDELRAMYTVTGLPARFLNDRHAAKQPEYDHAAKKLERGGNEFFGIAIETLVGDHGRFCKQFTPAEQSWLATELGDCLGGLPGKAGCFQAPNAGRTKIPGASGAGMLRD